MVGDVEVIQVIKTRLLRRGSGRDGETMRIVEQYWNMDGDLLWEIDTWNGRTYSPRAAELTITFNEDLSDEDRAAALTEMTTALQQVRRF